LKINDEGQREVSLILYLHFAPWIRLLLAIVRVYKFCSLTYLTLSAPPQR